MFLENIKIEVSKFNSIIFIVIYIQRRLKMTLIQHNKDFARLHEIFEIEKNNIIKFLLSVKKKQKEDYYDDLKDRLLNLEFSKSMVI
jgi:hypothetical protein